jgi:transcriptional regulator with XRE-family HTH domain
MIRSDKFDSGRKARPSCPANSSGKGKDLRMTRKATTPTPGQGAQDGPPRAGRRTRRKEISNRRPIGELLRERRAHHGWTLSDVSEKTGISTSALSKIENGLMSPTYHTIIQLCSGLDIEIGDLISRDSSVHPQPAILGRRSISRQQDGQVIEDENYRYTYLCSDVAHKRIIPIVIKVKANSIQQIKRLWSHVGEEYVYVLDGEIDLLSELYEPVRLKKDDSCYFDSTMEHAYLAAGSASATLLVTSSSATPNLAQTLRDVLRIRMNAGTPLDLAERVGEEENPPSSRAKRRDNGAKS